MIRRQHHIDMCNGPLWNKILLFALPLMASSILQLLFNAADVVVVGRYAGKEALAAVGSNSALINLMINLFVGLSVGTNVVVAGTWGPGGTTTSAAASTALSPWPSSAASAWPCSASLWSATCWSG